MAALAVPVLGYEQAASQSALLVLMELVSVKPGRCEGLNLVYNCHADCRKPGRATLLGAEYTSSQYARRT